MFIVKKNKGITCYATCFTAEKQHVELQSEDETEKTTKLKND